MLQRKQCKWNTAVNPRFTLLLQCVTETMLRPSGQKAWRNCIKLEAQRNYTLEWICYIFFCLISLSQTSGNFILSHFENCKLGQMVTTCLGNHHFKGSAHRMAFISFFFRSSTITRWMRRLLLPQWVEVVWPAGWKWQWQCFLVKMATQIHVWKLERLQRLMPWLWFMYLSWNYHVNTAP